MPRAISNLRYAATPEFTLGDRIAQTQTAPVITALPGGGFVAVWHDMFFSTSTVRAQIYDRNGREVGDEFVVGQGPESIEPGVTTLASGNFVVSWTVGGTPPNSFDIKGQIFDPTGAAVGSQFTANTIVQGFQTSSKISALAGGGFVMTWLQPNDGTFANVHGQVFAADGTKIGGEFIAGDSLGGVEEAHDVIGLAGGGFVVAWDQSGADPDFSYGSRAQLFDATGHKVGAAFSLNTNTTGYQTQSDLAALPSGGFVAVWADDGNTRSGSPDNGNQGIWAQLFDANGAKVGDDILVSELGPDGQAVPDVEIIPGVGFVVVWRDSNSTAEDDAGHLRGQIFDFSGNKTGEEFSINAGLDATQHLPDLAVLASGAFVVGWSNLDAPQFNDEDVRARIFFPTTLGTDGVNVMTGTADRDFLFGLDGDDQLSGGAEDDGLDGGGGNDQLDGGTGNDDLDGGAGIDSMDGGTGNDLYKVDNQADVVIEAAGGGDDRVVASTSWTIGAASEVETLEAETGEAPINLTGNALANALIGNDGANRLDGGAGADTMTGRDGDDWFTVDNAGDVVVETAGEGNDRIFASVSYALGANVRVETLSTTNNAGTAAINLTGNDFANTLFGNAGANILDGRGGFDVMAGFAGNDFYYVDNPPDRVIEAAGEGTDRVFASTSYALAAGVSVETLSTAFAPGTFAIDLTGNELAQTILGNAGANILDGRGGADTMAAFGGDDFYYVDTAADRVIEAAGEGNDRVFASASYTLAAGVSVETLSTNNNAGTAAINLTGNELANTLFGNAGANSLDGRAGADTMVGFAGNDFYYVDNAADRVIEAAGGGTDRVLTSTSYALAAGASVETLSTNNNAGTTAIDLTGNELTNTLIGNAGANVLDGKAGSDTLVGGAGADTFAFTTQFGGDRIGDFVAGTDKIALDDAIFTQLGGPGALNPDAFVAGTNAVDADDRIIYDQWTGRLYYDADGVGGTGALLFATLTNAPTITASDFQVI